MRDAHSRVGAIVEHKDATPALREIDEGNTGIMAAPTACFARWLSRLSNDNAQGEYYLTDVVAMAVDEGLAVEASQPAAVWETLGVNSRAQLAELERVHQRETAAALMERGVALADPARVDVRGSLECGRDVFVDVGWVFEGRVALGDGVGVACPRYRRSKYTSCCGPPLISTRPANLTGTFIGVVKGFAA